MSLLLALDMFFMMAMISVKNDLERFSHRSHFHKVLILILMCVSQAEVVFKGTGLPRLNLLCAWSGLKEHDLQ